MSRFLVERLRRRLAAEVGAIAKPHDGKLRIALAYPNRYYIGMSNVGFQAVYRFWNELPEVVCERVFLPDREEMKEHLRAGVPLLSLESQTPVREFDVLAFSITFEPDELNLVRMLDLAGIPPLAAERNASHPLVLAGGPVTFLNPEPMAPFLDVVAIGEAEALLPPLTRALLASRAKEDVVAELAESEGFYVPGAKGRMVRAKMGKSAALPPPATYVLTPSTEMANKFLVEVSRGCPTLCRFCWAGYNYLPKRSFDIERILEVARRARAHTGDIGLVSTAVGAHREIVPLVESLLEMDYRISVSSLRFEDIRLELVEPLARSGEKTLAVAPEVGSDRLRFAIHKRVTNEDILHKVDLILSTGIESLKLYLMVGLPTEREEDLEAMIDLVSQVRDRLLDHGRRRGRLGRIIPSVNPFIPKPGTPFQWHAMERVPELRRKMRRLERAMARMPNVEANFKSPRQERLQAVLSLGDRRLAPVIVRMARGEADLSRAMKEEGLALDATIHRERSPGEPLPWEHIDNGMKPELLQSQYEKASALAPSLA
ncbi:MAG TPA: radical SAM protein [Vicinamibacteria bacterium]|nr:radical SAM protein [Vicinamibacteria bacterium]